MELYLVIEDYGDGIAAYAYSTRALAEAARTCIEEAQDAAHRCLDTTWIVETILDQQPE